MKCWENRKLYSEDMREEIHKEVMKDFLVIGTPVYFMLAMFLHWLVIGY